jgi:hypothetical protein
MRRPRELQGNGLHRLLHSSFLSSFFRFSRSQTASSSLRSISCRSCMKLEGSRSILGREGSRSILGREGSRSILGRLAAGASCSARSLILKAKTRRERRKRARRATGHRRNGRHSGWPSAPIALSLLPLEHRPRTERSRTLADKKPARSQEQQALLCAWLMNWRAFSFLLSLFTGQARTSLSEFSRC